MYLHKSRKKKITIIAEIGENYLGSLKYAKKMIPQAKQAGADYAKFQSYKANKLASKFSPSYWDTSKEKTRSQYELFKKYDNFSENDYLNLSKYCKSLDIEFLSTPFDKEAIEFLDELMPFFKIASADITNIPFLRSIAEKSKPIILSTGASKISEIELSLETIKNISSESISYPELVIGYSDHTIPDKEMTALVAAYLKGALIIEKHFTDNKKLPGNDHYHAMDIDDLKLFKQRVSKINELIGVNEIIE